MAGSSCNHVWLLRWIPFWMGSYPLTRAACSLNMSREGNLFANEADVVSCFSFCNTKYKLWYFFGGDLIGIMHQKKHLSHGYFSRGVPCRTSPTHNTHVHLSAYCCLSVIVSHWIFYAGLGEEHTTRLFCVFVCVVQRVFDCVLRVRGCCAYFCCCLFAFVLAWVRYEWMYHTLRLCLNVFR